MTNQNPDACAHCGLTIGYHCSDSSRCPTNTSRFDPQWHPTNRFTSQEQSGQSPSPATVQLSEWRELGPEDIVELKDRVEELEKAIAGFAQNADVHSGPALTMLSSIEQKFNSLHERAEKAEELIGDKSTALLADLNELLGKFSAVSDTGWKIAKMRGKERDRLKREVEELRNGLGSLLDKLEVIHNDSTYQSVWTLYALHNGQYSGPNYAEEYKKARALVERKEEKA